MEIYKKKNPRKIEKHELKGAYLGSSYFFCYVCSSCILITKENREKNILYHVKSENHKLSSENDKEEANFTRNQKIYHFLKNIFLPSNPNFTDIKLEESEQIISGMSKIEVNYETETESSESPIEINESTFALYKNSDSSHDFQTLLHENAELHDKIYELEVLNSAKDLKIKSLLKRIKTLEETNFGNQTDNNIEQQRLLQQLEEAKLAIKLEPSSRLAKRNDPIQPRIIQPLESTKKIKKKQTSLQKALDMLEKGYRIKEKMFNIYISLLGKNQMDEKICILNSFCLTEVKNQSSIEIMNHLWNQKFKVKHTIVFIPILCKNKLWHLAKIDLVKKIIKIKTYEQNFINLEIEKIIEQIDFLKKKNINDYKFKYYIFNWISQNMEDFGIFLLKYLEKKCLGAFSTLLKNDSFNIRRRISKNIKSYLNTFYIDESTS